MSLQVFCVTAFIAAFSVSTCSAALSIPQPSVPGVCFRQGSKADELQIVTTMVREFMNPLGIDSNRFIVAVNPENRKDVFGWAQLRPLGPAFTDPKKFDASPGSGNIERDLIEDEIWDDFEEDDVDFPIGFASLPWTKEYREFSKSAVKRREKRIELLARNEKQSERGQNQLWELASVYVLPTYRHRGIGSELVRRVMARHAILDRISSDIFILTLATTKEWYQSLGFVLADQPPDSMKFEVSVGKILTNLISAELICMRYSGSD